LKLKRIQESDNNGNTMLRQMIAKIPGNRETLIARINRKDWWHVPPADPLAYDKRGKFYASTFREAEFWGRPVNTPETVIVQNPVIGDEAEIWKVLFGRQIKIPDLNDSRLLQWRWRLDARMKKAALNKGYDAIVLLSPSSFKGYATGRLPLSIELNILKCRGQHTSVRSHYWTRQ
jgi:hypothetical protein